MGLLRTGTKRDLPNLDRDAARRPGTDDQRPLEDLRRRHRRSRRPRSRDSRRGVLRPARSQRRGQDDVDQLRLQPDPDQRRQHQRVRLRARFDGGQATRRRRGAGPEPRPLHDRQGVARLPRRLFRDGLEVGQPPRRRDDRRLRPAGQGRRPDLEALGRDEAAPASRPRVAPRAAARDPRRADGRRRHRAPPRPLELHPAAPRAGHDDPPHHPLPRGGGVALRGHRPDLRRPDRRSRHSRRTQGALRRDLARGGLPADGLDLAPDR